MKSGITKLLTGLCLVSVSFLGALPAGAAPGLLTNGNFTEGNYVPSFPNAGYDTLSLHSTAITGWTVTSGNVDWINGYWAPPVSGSLSIDMNGNQPGTIESDPFTTAVGSTYVVQFYISGNQMCGPNLKKVWVSATGSLAAPFYNTPNGTSGSTYNSAELGQWAQVAYSFVATSLSTALSFAADGGNTSNCGAAIGNVTVTQVAGSGAQCKNGGWEVLPNPSTLMMFKNQGACVSYFATNGYVPIGSGN